MKANLLPVPSEWNNLLNFFSPAFSKPQFANFSLYATGLVVSHYTSITRLNSLAEDKDQSSLNRYLTESPWDEKKVKDKLSRVTVRTFPDYFIGVLDDTLSPKPYARKMGMLGIFRDGMDGVKKKGHNIVTFGLTGLKDQFVPFDNEVYVANSGRSKNDIGRDMIERLSKFKRDTVIMVFDAWYSNEKIIGMCKQQSKHFITELKSNRNVTLNNRERWVREHEKHIKEKDWDNHEINGCKFRSFSTSAFISKIGHVQLVFSQMWLEDDEKWSETYYLITDILGMSDYDIIRLFLKRNGVEGFHREAKQHLGLKTYQLRESRGIVRHLFLAMLVYVLLLMLCKHLQKEGERNLHSIGELCQYLKQQCYTTLLRKAKHYTSEYRDKLAAKLAYGM